ncbi:DUF4148 domain-containing protein [Burkholderia sp. 22PA0099]|uniref:DUF4148 domain-containing protein n=1 Tax=Burkholderia sp. 22PA0099 TaxID=3237372 RepID=UPI0039C2DD83
MKTLTIAAAALVLSTSAVSAFADGGIGRAGTYGDLPAAKTTSTLTRAQVRAELAQSQRDGTLALLRKSTSYPQGIELAQQRLGTSESGGPSSQLANR